MCIVQYSWSGRHYTNGNRCIWIYIDLFSLPRNWESAPGPTQCLVEGVVLLKYTKQNTAFYNNNIL